MSDIKEFNLIDVRNNSSIVNDLNNVYKLWGYEEISPSFINNLVDVNLTIDVVISGLKHNELLLTIPISSSPSITSLPLIVSRSLINEGEISSYPHNLYTLFKSLTIEELFLTSIKLNSLISLILKQ